jgi:gamma-glutamylcyclotransferase (GGCT)/AIG2-like uncharacterized protein YtfP
MTFLRDRKPFMSRTIPFLFVYGTLRHGSPHPMARFLAERARLVGQARVPGRLYDLGRYPGLTEPRTPEDWVFGDLFELEDPQLTLLELDHYEECSPADAQPWLFERRPVPVALATGETLTAWAYFYRGTVEENGRIVSGEYGARKV